MNRYSVFGFLVLFLTGCGSQTLKDEGLGSKSIEEAGGSTTTSSTSPLSIVSVSPAKGVIS
jgi:hypothetical protein